MRNNHLLLTRLPLPIQGKTKTIAKVLDVDEDMDKAKTHLQQVSMSLPKRKKETSPKSSASIIEKKTIIPKYVQKRGNRS